MKYKQFKIREKNREIADMVSVAIERSGEPIKSIAADSGVNASSIYATLTGDRQIPAATMRSFSKTNVIAAACMALQGTGLSKLFQYRKSDRHIMARVEELKIYDHVADDAMNALPPLLFNKNSYDDLNENDKKTLIQTAEKLADRMNVTLNLLMELDVRYNLHLMEIFEKKKNTASSVPAVNF